MLPATVDHDRAVLRPLVAAYLELCALPAMAERQRLWRRLHALQPERPMVLVRGGRVFEEVAKTWQLQCQDPFLRAHEKILRQQLFRGEFKDDMVFRPWLTVRAVFASRGWGLSIARTYSDGNHGAWKHEPPLTDLNDLSGLSTPRHAIDEAETSRCHALLEACVGDMLPIVVDRTPAYTVWGGDISTDLGYLRGIEQTMLDMYDNPEGLHRLCSFMGESIQRVHAQAEAAGDWTVLSHENQSMVYTDDLPTPGPDTTPVPRRQLWGYMAAQEFTLISPAMHEEFLLRYQLPILRQFGAVAYGCCEDLTNKIELLRQIPNLRRIAVAPAANIRRCAEQIGNDYVISYRPNPAEMVCCGFEPARVRRIIGEALDVFAGTSLEINLKDIDTTEGQPDRLRRWVEVVRDTIAARSS